MGRPGRGGHRPSCATQPQSWWTDGPPGTQQTVSTCSWVDLATFPARYFSSSSRTAGLRELRGAPRAPVGVGGYRAGPSSGAPSLVPRGLGGLERRFVMQGAGGGGISRGEHGHSGGSQMGSRRPLQGSLQLTGCALPPAGGAKGVHWGDFGCLGALQTSCPKPPVSSLSRATVGTIPHCGHACLQLGHTSAFGVEPVASRSPSAREPTQKPAALPGRTFLEPMLGVRQVK